MIAKHLTELLRKDGFLWTSQATEAFQSLKVAMSTTPVLALPNFSKDFIIETDASGFGLGPVLMQDKRPLSFFSHSLTPKEQLKSVYERELMAVVMSVQKWKHYLLGHKFKVHCDKKSLKFLMEQWEVTLEYQKWLHKLLSYEFKIIYKPGVENKAADGLSRIQYSVLSVSPSMLFALSIPPVLQLQEIYQEAADSAYIQELKTKIAAQPQEFTNYKIRSGQDGLRVGCCYQNRPNLSHFCCMNIIVAYSVDMRVC